MVFPRNRKPISRSTPRCPHAKARRSAILDPFGSQCSSGITSIDGARHQPTPFLLPGLTAQVKRAVLPSGSCLCQGRLGSSPRAARLFLRLTARDKRATLPTGIRTVPGRLGFPLRVARFFLRLIARVIRARRSRAGCRPGTSLARRPGLALFLLQAPFLLGARGYYSSQLKA